MTTISIPLDVARLIFVHSGIDKIPAWWYPRLQNTASHATMMRGKYSMELRINLGYEQILQLVKQLPRFEKQRLTHEIERELRGEDSQSEETVELDEFQKLLLNGPVMSDEQFEQFKALRKGLNAWIGN